MARTARTSRCIGVELRHDTKIVLLQDELDAYKAQEVSTGMCCRYHCSVNAGITVARHVPTRAQTHKSVGGGLHHSNEIVALQDELDTYEAHEVSTGVLQSSPQ